MDEDPASKRSARSESDAVIAVAASGGVAIPLAFADSARLRAQIHKVGLVPLQADFLRCLALSRWAAARPARRAALALPADARADDGLLVCMRRLGWPLHSLEDSALDICWELRWEFRAAGRATRAEYRVAPSYHDRLRLELLLDAWERVSRRPAGDDIVLDLLGENLARASAAFAARLQLPLALLQQVAAERRLQAVAATALCARIQKRLAAGARRGVHHLAIAAALAGDRDLIETVRGHGDASMRAALKIFLLRNPLTAQTELAPRIARLRRHLWIPQQRARRRPDPAAAMVEGAVALESAPQAEP
jgi:hypothetical protein